jgi:hypothetical protein
LHDLDPTAPPQSSRFLFCSKEAVILSVVWVFSFHDDEDIAQNDTPKFARDSEGDVMSALVLADVVATAHFLCSTAAIR